VFHIADRSWKVRVGGPMAEHHRAYLRETIRRFGRRGMIDFAFLNIAGRDAAFIIGIVERDVYYDLTISYDDEFADLSPGIHLMIELLRQLPDSGVRTVVSHGDHDYKNRWTKDWTTTSRLFVFKPLPYRSLASRRPAPLNRGRPALNCPCPARSAPGRIRSALSFCEPNRPERSSHARQSPPHLGSHRRGL
jgi:hypothetical protein